MPMLNNAYYRYNSGVYIPPIAVAPKPIIAGPSSGAMSVVEPPADIETDKIYDAIM